MQRPQLLWKNVAPFAKPRRGIPCEAAGTRPRQENHDETQDVGARKFAFAWTGRQITWIARRALPMFVLMCVAVLAIWF